MIAGRAHPHLDIRDHFDILKRHKEAQLLPRGNALIIGDIVLSALAVQPACPPAVEVTGQLAHVERIGKLGIALQISPADAQHDVVSGSRAGHLVRRQLNEIPLRFVARREELAGLVWRQAEPILTDAEGNAAHVRHRLVIKGAALVNVFDRACRRVDRRGDLHAVLSRSGQIVDRHGHEARRIALAEADTFRAERSGRTAHRRDAEHRPRFRGAQRDRDPLIGDQRDIVRQEDAERHPLALLREAADLLFQIVG